MTMLKHTIPAALEKHGPLTNEGLRRVCPGASRSGVHRLLQELKNSGKIYISGYFKSNGKVGGAHVPIYSLGNLPDVAKPVTRKEQQVARKAKPEPKDNGRPMVLRIAIKPMPKPEPMRARSQHAGMWGGLLCNA